MWASGRGWVKKEKEGEKKMTPGLSKKEASCVGRKQGGSSKGSEGTWAPGSVRSRFWPEGQVQPKKAQKDLSFRPSMQD